MDEEELRRRMYGWPLKAVPDPLLYPTKREVDLGGGATLKLVDPPGALVPGWNFKSSGVGK